MCYWLLITFRASFASGLFEKATLRVVFNVRLVQAEDLLNRGKRRFGCGG